jgi:hypothetical protein
MAAQRQEPGLTTVIGHADRAKPLRDYCVQWSAAPTLNRHAAICTGFAPLKNRLCVGSRTGRSSPVSRAVLLRRRLVSWTALPQRASRQIGRENVEFLTAAWTRALVANLESGGLAMRSLTIEQRRAVARRVFAALCAHYPERYVALVEQPGPNPTATTFVDCSMAENDSAVAQNSFSEFAASERKATEESLTSQRGEARLKGPASGLA